MDFENRKVPEAAFSNSVQPNLPVLLILNHTNSFKSHKTFASRSFKKKEIPTFNYPNLKSNP